MTRQSRPPSPARSTLGGAERPSPTNDAARKKSLKEGLCPDCGIRTHQVTMWGARKPLTTDQVRSGECLKCMPIGLGRFESPQMHGGATPGNPKVTETRNEDGTVTRTTKTLHPDGRVTAEVTMRPGPAAAAPWGGKGRAGRRPRAFPPVTGKSRSSRGPRGSHGRGSRGGKLRSKAARPKLNSRLHSVEEDMEELSVGTASTAAMTETSLSTAASKSAASTMSGKRGAGGSLPSLGKSSFSEGSEESSVGMASTTPTFMSAQSRSSETSESLWLGAGRRSDVRNIGGTAEGQEYYSTTLTRYLASTKSKNRSAGGSLPSLGESSFSEASEESSAGTASATPTRYLFLGRHAVGKKSIIESLANDPRHSNENCDIYLDAPGLEMREGRDGAAREICEKLRGSDDPGTDCVPKLVFVVTLGKDGHVNPADGVLMDLILDALPNMEEAISHGIIINNVTKEMRDNFNKDPSAWDAVRACLNEGRRQPTAYIHLHDHVDPVDEKENGSEGNLFSLSRFLDILPPNRVKPDKVRDIESAGYESLIHKTKNAFLELRNDATKRREKLQIDATKLRKQIAKMSEQQDKRFRESRKRKFYAASFAPPNSRSERPKLSSTEPSPTSPEAGKTEIPSEPSSIPWKLPMGKARPLPLHYPLAPQTTCCLYLRGDGQVTLPSDVSLPTVEELTQRISQVCYQLGIDGYWDNNFPLAKLKQKDGVEMLLRMHLVDVEGRVIIGGVLTGVSSICLPSENPTEYHPKALIIEAQRDRGCSLSFHRTWCKIFKAMTSLKASSSRRIYGSVTFSEAEASSTVGVAASKNPQDAIRAALDAPPLPQPAGAQYIVAINKHNERRYFAGRLYKQSRRAVETYFGYHGWCISKNLTCGEGMVCYLLTSDIIEGGYALLSER